MPLSQFHPASRNWFEAEFGQPTPAQSEAWAAIKAGRHTLISAPTGSGKTLAAFYAVIDKLLKQGLDQRMLEGVKIVYVSPLKALSNDIRKNLELPLDGIAEHLHLLGQAPVDIRVAVRTGDTTQSERQKMVRKPPDILVTTPESLYLLLSSASGRTMLANVSTIITDEIHALLGDKRGSHLALSIERLQALVSGNLQRIGLSATQKPIEMVAKYLVGNSHCRGERAEPGLSADSESKDSNENLNCVIVDSGFRRKMELRLEVPGSPLSALMSNEVWEELYQRLVQLIETHDTTLVFVNTRRLSERLALALGKLLGEEFVCSHHGSMSKDHRHNAEQRLKAGDLKVLVATASMELGIDIGSVDLVVQFSSPKRIATFLQRVGRSGHSITGTPKAVLFPLTRDDLTECTALLHGIQQGQLDRIVMPQQPMDILAQQIVAEVAAGANDQPDGAYDVEQLFHMFASSYPYRHLQRSEFDTIVSMVAEGYSSRRGRRGAHLHFDAINQKLRPRRGANLVSLTNGGAIPDMFDYQVVLDPEDTVVGSLNEDFALEALPGDIFTLGSHSWQMIRVDGLKVRVRDAQGLQPTIPFWFGEGPGRSRELSEAVSGLREKIARLIAEESLEHAANWLRQQLELPSSAAEQLVHYLNSGMQALGVMPTRETLVMERFFDEVGDMHLVIHSPFGVRINRGWGLALRKRFCRAFNFELQAAANEDSIVISLGAVHSFPLQEVFNYLQTASLRDVLVQALLDAPMFEVRWRWNATRALAIQRNRSGKRVPPQFQRMDAEDFVAHVFPDQIACQENLAGKRTVPDHPLVQQTIHDCLTEAMDIEELTELIGDIENGRLQLIAKDLREPSPFAQEIINARPYAFLDDAPFEERRTNAIRNRSWLDPAEAKDFSVLDAGAIEQVKQEAWPFVRSKEELHDALLTHSYMTEAEFSAHAYHQWQQILETEGRICLMQQGLLNLWIATENIPCFQAVFTGFDSELPLPVSLREQHWEPQDALREILRGRLDALGPVTAQQLAGEMQLEVKTINGALLALEVEGFIFQGNFTASNGGQLANQLSNQQQETEWCERRLLQRIHKYSIDAHRETIKPVSLQTWTQFLFEHHQFLPIATVEQSAIGRHRGDGQTRLQSTLNLLDGLSAPAAVWESDIFPSRISDYDPGWLDIMCISGRVSWGRVVLAASGKAVGQTSSQPRRASSPIKSTPVSIYNRSNLDIWQALAAGQNPPPELTSLSGVAQQLQQDLLRSGASFFSDLQMRTGLLKTQIEEGLGELVASGFVTSDSYTGLRALLTPNDRKPGSGRRRGRKAMFGVEDAGRWSLIPAPASAQTEELRSRQWDLLDEEQLQRLLVIYLQRWGVVFKKILERESFAPPWRILLRGLRKMELQGTVRGGRFIAGVSGEQFAFSACVDTLRRLTKNPIEGETCHVLAATDPLNVLNLISPDTKLSRVADNRVLFCNAIPVAVLASGQVHYLRAVEEDQQWQLEQILRRRKFPLQLQSYTR